MAAMGAGRYNVDTAQARAINAETALQWNQYMYQAKVEGERIYNERMARDQKRSQENIKAHEARLRTAPNEYDITTGNALNAAVLDLSDPKVYPKAVYYANRVKVGGEDIRDIPFQYAAAAITVSVHQLTQGKAPAPLQRAEFGPDREKLKAVAAELRKEGEELGTHKPETIKKAKDQIMATKAKAESVLPKNSQELRDAEKYIKALYGLASMLETPAVNVLLSGVEKRPDASLGDLLGFMQAYNLRFGAATTPRQRQLYMKLYPELAKLRNEVIPSPGSNPPPSPTVDPSVPAEVFGALDYNHAEVKPPAPPKPQ